LFPERKVRNVKISKRARHIRGACSVIAMTGGLLVARTASAEVTLLKGDKWEVYTAGRVNAFFSYAFGEAYPVGMNSLVGGGVDTSNDRIPALKPDGTIDTSQAGTISKMRVRSGFVPNVLTLGVRRNLTETTKLTAQFSIWGTIETAGQRKYFPVNTDWREGYLEAEGPWGTFRAGRFGSLFSRGITEMDFLYGHGYGVGFPGGDGLYNTGPTAGLIGFGVLASSFSPGLLYATPMLSGLQLSVGIFDPVQLAGAWESTRSARPEGELTYDMTSGLFRTHLFVNGAYQKLYDRQIYDETVKGVGYGGRFEYGPVHLGAGGHYGKGLGLYYALEGSPADHGNAIDPNHNEFRLIDGYSLFVQYAAGIFDVNLAYGISRVHLLDFDKSPANTSNESVIKSQTGISAGVVYHVAENLHVDVDYLNAKFLWYAGEKQTVNYINTGVTMTW
jgi:hypothetical protein